jgi:hypothetical protein
MVILYFDSAMHDFFHATYYRNWTDYENFRAGESAWMIPGTDPEDPLYAEAL